MNKTRVLGLMLAGTLSGCSGMESLVDVQPAVTEARVREVILNHGGSVCELSVESLVALRAFEAKIEANKKSNAYLSGLTEEIEDFEIEMLGVPGLIEAEAMQTATTALGQISVNLAAGITQGSYLNDQYEKYDLAIYEAANALRRTCPSEYAEGLQQLS